MKKLLAMLVLVALSLAGGVELGKNPPTELLATLDSKFGITIPGLSAATAAPPPAAAGADAAAKKKLIPLDSLNLQATDAAGTVYTLSVNAALDQNSLAADLAKLAAALYKTKVLATVDSHGNEWFVLTTGEYGSREEAQRAGAVLYGNLGLSGVAKKLPPAPPAAGGGK